MWTAAQNLLSVINQVCINDKVPCIYSLIKDEKKIFFVTSACSNLMSLILSEQPNQLDIYIYKALFCALPCPQFLKNDVRMTSSFVLVTISTERCPVYHNQSIKIARWIWLVFPWDLCINKDLPLSWIMACLRKGLIKMVS